jgi:hypothetical protein
MAQVYSVNAVGYINLEVPAGLSMIANQLDNMDGNLVADLMPADAPEGTIVYKFAGTFSINTFEFGEWSDLAMTLAPGEGAFILNPTDTPYTVTFVGEVPQGALATDLPSGLAIVSSQVPQAGHLQTDLEYPAEEGDIVYRFRREGADGYTIYTFEFGEWSAAPNIEVGEGFWVQKAAAGTWSRDFSVNP